MAFDKTQEKIYRVLRALSERAAKDPQFAQSMLDGLDMLLDDLLDRGAFGKKGKDDPRGDQTRSFGKGGPCWTMRRTEEEDG